jgi:hypothetical protein
MTNEADAAAGGGPLTASPTKDSKVREKQQKKMTKREKRKTVNETNKWPQHPKIQDMEVRSKAYVRVAGLGASTKKKESVDPKLDLMSPEVKFGRLLGSTDQRKRHVAVQKLKAYLTARCDIHNENGGLSEMDLLKLWKGLWYTLYMADKTPVQDELSKHLAELLWCVAGTEEEDEYAGQTYMDICEAEEKNAKGCEDQGCGGCGGCEDSDDPDVTLEELVNTLDDDEGDEEEDESDKESASEEAESKELDHEEEAQEGSELDEEELDDSEVPHCRGAHLASLFIRTFFRTVKREWGNMDKYRVDKFYTLARLYIHEIFKYMASRHWNLGIIRLFNDAIFEEVLNEKPNGLRYHLIDVVLDELAKVNAKAPMQLTEATFLDTLEPYFAMAQTGAGNDDTVQSRVVENVLEKFLNKYSVVGEVATSEDDNDEEAKELVFVDVHVGTVAQFIFEIASDAETKDQYRKSLYELHKSYVRRLKKVGRDVSLNEQEEEPEDVEMDAEKSSDEAVDHEMEETNESAKFEEEEPSKEEEIETPPPSKKDKKRRKHQEVEKDDEADQNAQEFETPPPKKKKRIKKQKAQKGSKSTVGDEEEEVVTISLGDQKKAKADRKSKKKKQSESKTVATPTSADKRRVKWLPNNKSKSYKASIKGLLTASLPKTSQVTPEKSILLNKGQVRRAGVTKAGRKKAVNYF